MVSAVHKPEYSIWKFALQAGDEVFVEMPKGATILSLQTQYQDPTSGRESTRTPPRSDAASRSTGPGMPSRLKMPSFPMSAPSSWQTED